MPVGALAAESLPPAVQPAATTPLPTYTGHVDSLEVGRGLVGWAVSLSGEIDFELVLRAGSHELARTRPRLVRHDVWATNRLNHQTGFIFSIDSLLLLLTERNISLSEPLEVSIVGTQQQLPMQNPWTLGDLSAVLQASLGQLSACRELVGLPPHHALDLALRRAVRWLLKPRHAHQQRLGVIEFFCFLPGQHLIIGGWWRRSQSRLSGAVMYSGGKRSVAAMLVACRERSDLDADHCGFIGILRMQAMPEMINNIPNFLLYLGEDQADWIELLHNARVLPVDKGLHEFDEFAATADTPSRHELAALVREHLPWTPDPRQGSHLGIHAGIDQLLVIPRFGALVSGWVLSPIGTLVDVAALFGDAVLLMELSSLSLRPRPDLKVLLPELADRTAQAGFSVVLRNHMVPNTSQPWWLRMRFSDGSASWVSIPMAQVRMVDQDFDVEHLARFDPCIDQTPWLSDLVDAVWGLPSTEIALTFDPPTYDRMPLCFVVTLSTRPSDTNLCLDRLSWVAEVLARHGIGLAVLVPAHIRRGEFYSWREVVTTKLAPGIKLAWGHLPSQSNPWQQLPVLLSQLQRQRQTHRFLFAGPQVVLTAQGAERWAQTLLANLEKPLEHPLFPGIEHIGSGDHSLLRQDAQLFAWETDPFLARLPDLPAMVGGWHANNALHESSPPPPQGASAWQLGGGRTGTLATRINRRRLEAWRHLMREQGSNAR